MSGTMLGSSPTRVSPKFSPTQANMNLDVIEEELMVEV